MDECSSLPGFLKVAYFIVYLNKKACKKIIYIMEFYNLAIRFALWYKKFSYP